MIMLLACRGVTAFAAEPCTGFKWDVRKEQAIFAGASSTLAAGKQAASTPSLGIDRLYQLQLIPQSEVTFTVEPGKKKDPDGAYAGLATLDVDVPGNYRVAVDASLWIDVTAHGKLATVNDYQGQQGCDAPHKIVEFDLSGAKHFVLQFSASSAASIRVAVTKVPAGRLPP
jgi:hypothetical protein